MLGIDNLRQRRMRVRVRAAAKLRAPLQHSDLGSAAGERHRRSESGQPATDHQDIFNPRAHTEARSRRAIRNPRKRIQSLRGVETEMRGPKTWKSRRTSCRSNSW